VNLYNSLSQRVEPFEPQSKTVSVYVCGITPYDTTHLGHAFTYTSADILIRYLEYQGYQVRYVQNVTDIDDDLLKRAAATGEDWKALGNRWTVHFIQDLSRLNVRPPDVFPRATDVIQPIIETVAALLESGVGYQAGGSVYFDVDRFTGFGQLSHLPRGEMLPIANERGNRPDDPNKRHALDFVLWQAQAPGEPAWESPWGPGRPGWHIECSTMATRLLGETVDIHAGGLDLIFPHHECEIAQVEPLTAGPPFVRTWMHMAMVRHEGEKMSKSLGNLVMVSDLLEDVSPDALRIYLARHHYRAAWSYDREELLAALAAATQLAQAATARGADDGTPVAFKSSKKRFEAAMDNDLDSAAALAALGELAAAIHAGAGEGRSVAGAQRELRSMSSVVGLRLGSPEPEERVRAGWQEHLKRFEPLPASTGDD
jgi:L-cysteine:1D-myo-inositol 2-amino-2-deoxy-alpha-D-glucopyranoside ligase